jgi:hypothetical protein
LSQSVGKIAGRKTKKSKAVSIHEIRCCQDVAQSIFVNINTKKFTVENSSPDVWANYVNNFRMAFQIKQSPIGRNGVDVMITIFCDFSQFSAKKIGVFLKFQCYDQLFSKFSFVLSQKRQFFRKIFGENI